MEQESWFWALRFRMWSWAGYRPGDRYLEINLNPRVAWKKRLQDRLFRCAYLTFNADNQDSERILTALRDRRIAHINGFSSSLYVLARYMLENGIANETVIGITSTGDGLYPAYRDTIEKAFGVRVLDYYGAGGEGFHVASQCPASGSRYHIHPENAVVEILGPNGPADPGAPGRVVVTQLDNAAMPLVRYELGDVAVASDTAAQCPCGRTLPFLESIEGRVPDLIVSPNGTFLVPHFFVVLFKSLDGIRHYQIVQHQTGQALVKLVGENGVERSKVERAISSAFDNATNKGIDIEFEWTDDIPLTGAGKRRLVISAASAEVLGAAGPHPDSGVGE
jgi:phenylacetate-CoA ligase